MERAQASQPMPRPPTPLLPGRRHRRLCRTPLMDLGDSTPPRNWTGRLVQLWTPPPPPPPSRPPPPPSRPPPPTQPTTTQPLTSSLPLAHPFIPSLL